MGKYIILGHENPDNDSIVSGYLLEKLMKKNGYDVEFIIPDEIISEENIMLANYCGINPESFQKNLPQDPTIKYILVDHHERNVPGEIAAIIDHHPTDKEITCTYYQNEPACSTSCLIAKEHENDLSTDDLKAVCLSAMVDTAAFHSNKTVETDYIWVRSLCSKHGFNYTKLITTSMCPTDIKDLKVAATNGLKTYNIAEKRVASSFLHLPNPEENKCEIDEIISYIKTYINEEGYDLFAFIIHDITNFNTTLYKISEETIVKVEYDEYTSRGTRIIPELTNEIKTYQKKKATC